jgi:hypothetical protein
MCLRSPKVVALIYTFRPIIQIRPLFHIHLSVRLVLILLVRRAGLFTRNKDPSRNETDCAATCKLYFLIVRVKKPFM